MKQSIIYIILLLIPIIMLNACGFTPMYAEKHQTTVNLAQVEIGIIPDRIGQMLRNDLIDRFYGNQIAKSTPTYKLIIAPITETRSDLDITKSSESTRSQLRLKSTMSITDMNGKVIATRELFAIASFNVLRSEFATMVTKDNARENAVHDLARQIELNTNLILSNK